MKGIPVTGGKPQALTDVDEAVLASEYRDYIGPGHAQNRLVACYNDPRATGLEPEKRLEVLLAHQIPFTVVSIEDSGDLKGLDPAQAALLSDLLEAKTPKAAKAK